jgi:GT2 family glycosyltransferase
VRRTGVGLPATSTAAAGISVVIPSRDGKALLEAQLGGIAADMAGVPGEIIVVDNGSADGTAEWLRGEWPQVVLEVSAEPLSFAAAVNRGIRRARFSHVCLLNNDMRIEPGFFAALRTAFQAVPDLFCATAQIRFPAGVRREETGKAVMAQAAPEDFPIRCDEPLAGEDGTWVLYGSGGCSAYDAAKLRALGGVDEAYAPAYVEDLDLGYRAWLYGWPSVYVAGAVVEHRHRATTSRYYSEQELAAVLEINYLKFLARAVASPRVFRRLWRQALDRLRTRAASDPAARAALESAAKIARGGGPGPGPAEREESLLALTDGSTACFPGRAATGKPAVMIAARGWNQVPATGDDGGDAVLLVRVEQLQPPPADWLARYAEIVEARSDAAFDAAAAWTARKWRIGS